MAQRCIASIKKRREKLTYEAYITDILKGLFEIQNSSNNRLPRYIEGVLPKEPEEEETGDDVIERIKRNLMGKGD